MKKEPEPIRINKYLALKGFSTRRGADELISKGYVKVNGRTAKVGDKVSDTDTVEVAGKSPLSSYAYLAYNKPSGIVTNSPSALEKDILSSAQIDKTLNIHPVGRLDKESSGLIILTNDTRIVEPLLSPNKAHEREYYITINEIIKRDFEQKISAGVKLSDHRTKPCDVIVHNKNSFSITLTEGKNRQIRRMCAALGYSVKSLRRVRIMHIQLGNLKPNQYREIAGQELQDLLSILLIEKV